MLHLIALGFLAAIVRDPSLLEELEREGSFGGMETRPTSPNHGIHPRDHSLIYREHFPQPPGGCSLLFTCIIASKTKKIKMAKVIKDDES